MGELMTTPMRDVRALVTFGVSTYLASNILPLKGAALVGLLTAYYIYNGGISSPSHRLAGRLQRMQPQDPLPPRAYRG